MFGGTAERRLRAVHAAPVLSLVLVGAALVLLLAVVLATSSRTA